MQKVKHYIRESFIEETEINLALRVIQTSYDKKGKVLQADETLGQGQIEKIIHNALIED